MKIAILGAGLSGLSLAWELLEAGNCDVSLFEGKKIGGGASGVASGLMHPYTGEQGRRSLHADEAMQASLHLLRQVEKEIGEPVAHYNGILRTMQDEQQQAAFQKHVLDYGDVEQVDERSFLIRSGITVHCEKYLAGLWQLIEKRGGKLFPIQVGSLSELIGFDSIVIAAGAGIAHFPECASLGFKLVKGQVLTASAPPGFKNVEESRIGKGYVAVGAEPGIYHLGSTYERGFSTDEPHMEVACKRILPKIPLFFPDADQLTILGCKAGVRVARVGHYFPIVCRIDEKCWAFTALGSRGLLYHAYLAELLKCAILSQDDENPKMFMLPKNGTLA